MKSNRIGVLMGGTSAERAVSLASGRAVATALRDSGHRVVPIVIDSMTTVGEQVRDARIDVAFLALHGTFGEDGCMQAALELLGIPYTGSSVLSSALAMDKLKSKELFRLHNVPTPPYYVVDAAVALEELPGVHGAFGFPVVVKPRREGSSIGVQKASTLSQLACAVGAAREHDRCVLVERFIRAREVAVGILDGRVLGAIEVCHQRSLYDYEAKYTLGQAEYFVPARLAPARYRGVLNLAEQAARAVDATGAVRVDLLVTEGMNEYVLEVNTLPGMTPTSLLPRIAEAAGFSFGALCEAILRGARLYTSRSRAAHHLEADPPQDAVLSLAV